MEENNFSTFIKELRMEKGLSQEELAKALYVHRTTVNKWGMIMLFHLMISCC